MSKVPQVEIETHKVAAADVVIPTIDAGERSKNLLNHNDLQGHRCLFQESAKVLINVYVWKG